MRKKTTDDPAREKERLLRHLKNCDSLADFLSLAKVRESDVLDLLTDKDFKDKYFETLILKTELTAFDLALKGNNPMLQFLLINHLPDTYKKTGGIEKGEEHRSRILYVDAEKVNNGIQEGQKREPEGETEDMEKET